MIGVELEEVKVRNGEFSLTSSEHGVLINALLGAQAKHNGEESLVLLGTNVTSTEETVLLEVNRRLLLVLSDADNGETDVLGPDVHDSFDGLATGITQSSPEITSLGVTIGMLLDVVANTLEEHILAEVLGDHAKDRRALGVGNSVEDLVNLIGALDRHLDRVTAAQRVKRQSALQVVNDVGLPDLPLGVEDVARVPRHPGCETFVEPETIPEVHGNQVTEPLVSQFVLDNLGNALLSQTHRWSSHRTAHQQHGK